MGPAAALRSVVADITWMCLADMSLPLHAPVEAGEAAAVGGSERVFSRGTETLRKLLC